MVTNNSGRFLSEDALIQKIARPISAFSPSVVYGIGDDCAVLKKNAREYTLVSLDALVEDVHFRRAYFSFFELGQKAAAVNLSDIAAMGGYPEHALISLEVPKSVRPSDLQKLYAGLRSGFQPYRVSVVGGNLSKSLEKFSIHVTILGSCPKTHLKLRSKARVGDFVCVSGPLGQAALGFRLLESRARLRGKACIKAFKTPKARVELAQVLARRAHVHAMMDLSDGLLADLRRLVVASRVSARIDWEQVPLANGFASLCERLSVSVHQMALAGGEDYELLFTVSPRDFSALQTVCHRKGYSIFKIGQITPPVQGVTVQVFRNAIPWPMPSQWGFDHFR